MPIYEYRCRNGHNFEVLQSMSDDPVTKCEVCEAPVERVFHPVAVHFKGSGFYSTDYGRARGGGGGSSDSGSKDESKKDTTAPPSRRTRLRRAATLLPAVAVTVRSPTEQFFRALYDAFNARNIDTVIASMHPDVDWPNMIEGGREHGHAAVREYWRKQFESTDPRVEPERVVSLGDDQVLVEVHQVVRDPAGKVLSDGKVEHVYVLRDGLIERMDVRGS